MKYWFPVARSGVIFGLMPLDLTEYYQAKKKCADHRLNTVIPLFIVNEYYCDSVKLIVAHKKMSSTLHHYRRVRDDSSQFLLHKQWVSMVL